MSLRPCMVCSAPCPGPRCPEHTAQHGADAHRVRHSGRYLRLRRRVIDAWIMEHGPLCPGYRVPAHVAHNLTLDHVVPLELGGAPLDPRNAAALCHSCNSRKRVGMA